MIKRYFKSRTFPVITLAALLVAGTLFQHASQAVAADDIPASVVEELKPRPDRGARTLSDISEEAQKVWRKHLTETSHRVMQSLPREHKQQIYNTMVSVSGMSMRDMFNFMAAKKKVAEGVTFDEVIEA
ncbi:MAG: hypothetical protein QGF90_02865, partial [Gammaproteobacteria bacterium]|nr:hypothetical protein [Gammaproteobacteria bacterium]